MVNRPLCRTRLATEMLGVSLQTTRPRGESGLLEAWKKCNGFAESIKLFPKTIPLGAPLQIAQLIKRGWRVRRAAHAN